MFKWISHVLSRITGVSTPLGGISWTQPEARTSKVPTLSEPIYITYAENQKVISFLEVNDNRIVFINTFLDASVSTEEQYNLVEKERLDIDSIVSCEFSGVPLPLPNKEGRLVTITFHFSADHVLNFSAGGTGIVRVGIDGFFGVSRTFHGGPTTAFHLKEVKASLEAKIDILNR